MVKRANQVAGRATAKAKAKAKKEQKNQAKLEKLNRKNEAVFDKEGIIRKLNKHLGLKPTPVDGEIGETVWSMLHGDSSLTANETANLVINRFQVQEVGSNLGEVADILDDCFLPGDQEKILRAVASKNKESQIATEVRATCMSTYKAVLNALPAGVKKRGEAERKKKEAAEAKEQKTMQREINRSYDKVNENVEKVWKTVLPPKAKAYTDEYNGRWRLSYITNGPTCQRSISWSTKGSKKAAGEALRQAWEWARVYDGILPTEAAEKCMKAYEA